MNLSVILATLKRNHLLDQTLKSFCSLKTGNLEWEVLVVDNAGDSETRDVMMKYSGKIPLRILVEKCQGKNHALNRAVEEASGELFVFTDDDVIPELDWLTEIWEGAQRWPGFFVFGGRCIPKLPEGKRIPFDHPFFENAFSVADWDLPEGCYNADRVYGPNMAVRSSVFDEGWRFNPDVGPDGTKFYQMGSETEFTTRLERAGFKAVYLPRSVVFHQVRPEQLTRKYMYARSFRTGREDAFNSGIPALTGVQRIPLRLFLRLMKEASMFASTLILSNEKDHFNHGLKYWHTRGMIYQYGWCTIKGWFWKIKPSRR